ncbi:unnamed protein product [Absidia cylindrospora]
MILKPNILLSSLKDFDMCNDNLAASVKQTLLEPFQPDLSHPDPLKRPVPPTQQEFKAKAKLLAPLAMRVINQNLTPSNNSRNGDTKTKNQQDKSMPSNIA